MCMVPVSARLEEPELVHKALSRWNRALRDSDRTVLKSRVLLKHAMEVDRRVLIREAVDDIDLDDVSNGSRDGRVRPLSVDADKPP